MAENSNKFNAFIQKEIFMTEIKLTLKYIHKNMIRKTV